MNEMLNLNEYPLPDISINIKGLRTVGLLMNCRDIGWSQASGALVNYEMDAKISATKVR